MKQETQELQTGESVAPSVHDAVYSAGSVGRVRLRNQQKGQRPRVSDADVTGTVHKEGERSRHIAQQQKHKKTKQKGKEREREKQEHQGGVQCGGVTRSEPRYKPYIDSIKQSPRPQQQSVLIP